MKVRPGPGWDSQGRKALYEHDGPVQAVVVHEIVRGARSSDI